MSLEPLALSVVLLLFWTGLGWSLIAALEPGMEPLSAMLVAPVVGVALTLLPVFWFNALGLPVTAFARPLALALLAVTVVMMGWRRPSWHGPDALFAAVVLLALALIGFPTLRFGFDWIANANDDWGNYNLRAIRYLNGGFYQQPSIEAMREGRDYPGFFWFFDVAEGARPGSDLLLAWVSALVGKSPFFVFMPLILAFHGALCFAAASLARSALKTRTALLAGLLATAVAPLSLYAVHQQLIAQVVGLAFTCAMASLTFVPLHRLRSPGRIGMVAVVSSGYLLLYPELVPFFGLAFVLFHASHALEKNWGWERCWPVLAIVPVAGIFLGPYSVDALFYLLSQFQHSATQGTYDGISIFPYFIVPSGMAVLFGFSRLGELFREPWLSISIAAGFVGLAVVVASASLGLARRQSIAFFLIVLLLMVAVLVLQHNDFGIFKIAMFGQVFIWFAIVAMLVRLRLSLAIPIYLALFLTLMVTDMRYLMASLNDGFSTGNSTQNASRGRLLSRLLATGPDAPCDADFETPLPPLIKILAGARGCARIFIARPTLFSRFAAPAALDSDSNPVHNTVQIREFVERAFARLRPASIQLPFDYPPLGSNHVVISKPPVEYEKSAVDTVGESIFSAADSTEKNLNRLIFMNSNLGSHYYLPESGVVSIYATEADSMFPGGRFAGVGRYVLFKVASPSKSVRLVLDITRSILGDGEAKLPAATVVGATSVPIGLSGRGAARVISPPFSPLMVDGAAYALLDLGDEPKQIPIPRPGLMGLYGTKVPIDPRRMVAFVRKIRLIDADGPASAAAPAGIQKFPADLASPNLEFSGIYEDGWLGEEGFIVLSSACSGKVVFRGMFPNGLGLSDVDLTLTVAGGEPLVKHLLPGPFEVVVPADKGRSRIEFKFSEIGRLPSGDGRPATALLSSVSIVAGDSSSLDDPASQTPQACD
jgi:hypothetical protein